MQVPDGRQMLACAQLFVCDHRSNMENYEVAETGQAGWLTRFSRPASAASVQQPPPPSSATASGIATH